MAETITDLTGYTWIGNDTLSSSVIMFFSKTYYVNFLSNNTNFDFIYALQQKIDDYFFTFLLYNDSRVYVNNVNYSSWVNTNYKTIQITGGTDATNTDLIAWLQENGTLTKSSAILAKNKYRSSNDFSVTMPATELTQDFTFTSNKIEFSGMRITTDTLYYVKSDGTETEVYNTSTKWAGNTEYIAMIVSEDTEVSDDFYSFFETLYKSIDNFEYTLKIKGHETYAIKLNLGGTTYEIK